MLRAVLLVAALASCQKAKRIGGDVAGTFAEYIVCPLELESIIECGHVFQCTGTPDPNPGGFIEVCIDDDDQEWQLDAIEAQYGMCEPTPRHQGICAWCCGADCGRGANAYNGSYCMEMP